jgi:cytochrome b pre-mRNA-processing protein 3
MLNAFKKSGARNRVARVLEAALVSRAREPAFYAALGVPDTIDGRFDLVTLHAWLVLARLREAGDLQLSQALTDAVFVGFDEALRDMGSGDMGIARRLKAMANAFYGRLAAYEAATNEAMMAEALTRNVYRGATGVESEAKVLAHYVFAARNSLKASQLSQGEADFGALPG